MHLNVLRQFLLMPRPRISIIGAGKIGSSTALRIAEKELGDVVLVDIDDKLPRGEALDLMHSAPLAFDVNISGSADYNDIKGSDIVIITAGRPRAPGMDRMDLLKTNAGIVKTICEKVREKAPESIVIVVSNPMDMMTFVAYRTLGFPRERVLGENLLDSLRLSYIISRELGVSAKSVSSMVIGEHGETMVPLLSHSSVNGTPVSSLIPNEKHGELIDSVRKSAMDVIETKGATIFAPTLAIAHMAEAILRDKKSIMPVSAYLEGEYGAEGICIGVPAKLGRKGIEEILRLELSDKERESFQKSAEKIKGIVQEMQKE